ncbi:MAG TPA: hypothetical protein DD730_15685 [Desulfosporosinus sp.]|jgi:DNA-binding response OmpR family regulator|nr:hypothetical protein [Desulfosporosinus sp.]
MARILILDDNIYFARLIASQLTRLGYAVRVMEAGEELLDLLRAERYDLLIMELLLQGQDGLTLLQTLSCSPFSYLRVLIVSHRTSYVDQQRVAEYDADFLSKPVDLYELLEKVPMFLKRKSWEGRSL